jgi:hypothetical protein
MNFSPSDSHATRDTDSLDGDGYGSSSGVDMFDEDGAFKLFDIPSAFPGREPSKPKKERQAHIQPLGSHPNKSAFKKVGIKEPRASVMEEKKVAEVGQDMEGNHQKGKSMIPDAGSLKETPPPKKTA